MDRPNEPPMAEPLAYFLTWPTYGTWLPGDERGWVKRGRGFQMPDEVRKLEAKARMAEKACILDRSQQELVERTIAEHCRIRGWTRQVVNCRSNHVHVVLTADRHPDEVRDQLKAWCTRRLKELDGDRAATSGPSHRPERKRWWAEGASTRYINDEESLESAILYVLEGQDRRP